ncbi:MAG: dicarboxylate/amino acid:cation symporter [Alphaproteobacteria bacterium]
MNQIIRSIRWIILALAGGAGLGLAFPEAAMTITPVTKFLLQLIKAAATPLVLFAVLEAILRYRVAGGDFLKLLVITLINSAIAISIGLLIANVFAPGQYLTFLAGDVAVASKDIDFLDLIAKQLPVSIVQPLADNSIMPVVIMAIAFGFAWRRVRANQDADAATLMDQGAVWISFAREMCETVLIWIVTLIPIAVFAATARVTAEHGLHPFKGLGQYVLLCLLGMAIHVLFTYSAWLIVFVRISLRDFWRLAIEPALYSFGVNSSLVALPLTLRTLDKLGISRRASTLAAVVGTNLNNDGIILYEGFTLLALAQAGGIEMSLAAQIFAALYCIIAAMGVAGVPEAGIVALTLVLSGLGIPTEALALLLSVDWIIARARSLLNTTSDLVGSMALNRWLEISARQKV